MVRNIFKLTKIFFKNSFQNPYIIDEKTNKINKKSIFVWLIIIVTMAITYFSFEIIKVLVGINKPTIFLNVLFLILDIIMAFQVILASTNVYFFSKDLDMVLPLPIKAEELLISKFNTILINLYFTESIFAVFPLIIYGILTNSGIFFYFYTIIILLIFPILINLIISIIMMFLIKLSKFIKNKDIFQIIITLIFIFLILFLEFKIFNNIIGKIDNNLSIDSEQVISTINNLNNKLENINNYFLIINPTIKILNNYNKLISIYYLIKIIFINLIFLLLFIFIGKKYYLKNILNNINNFYIKKINKNNIEKKLKKINIKKSYLKKEVKILFNTPIFFIKCIFPTIIMVVSFVIIVLLALPNLRIILTTNLFR